MKIQSLAEIWNDYFYFAELTTAGTSGNMCEICLVLFIWLTDRENIDSRSKKDIEEKYEWERRTPHLFVTLNVMP